MTLQEKAASLNRDEIVSLLESEQVLSTRVDELQQQLDWLKRQLFGSKSERRVLPSADTRQLALGEAIATTQAASPPQITVPSHTRSHSKEPLDGSPGSSKLRFDKSVPIVEIELPNEDTEIYPPESYDVVGKKFSIERTRLRTQHSATGHILAHTPPCHLV